MKTFENDNSGNLFDTLIANGKYKNDRELSDVLGIAAPVVSRIRNGKLGVSSGVILSVHEKLGMPVSEIRSLIGK